MRVTRTLTWVAVAVTALTLASAARADWDPGDPFKMHNPQLPDPVGWDVAFDTWVEGMPIPVELADDWMCSRSGPVSDIHFWISWEGDRVGAIDGVWAGIYADLPVGPGYSEPDLLVWDRFFEPAEVTVRQFGQGVQGWYEPLEPDVVPDDHSLFFQVNIEDISDPFIQNEGEIYWLSLYVPAQDADVGWKTSRDHWNNDAVFMPPPMDGPDGGQWLELRDPITGESLDLAFVITPEPATLALLGLGAAGFVLRCRRRRPK